MKKVASDSAEKLGKELSTMKAFTIVNLIAILVVAVIALLK
jgi:competence protein ComGC